MVGDTGEVGKDLKYEWKNLVFRVCKRVDHEPLTFESPVVFDKIKILCPVPSLLNLNF